jgi:hypothetical protein
MNTNVAASELVAALEVAWSAIQDRHPDVPPVLVTLGAGSIGVPAGSLRLGHFAARRWVAAGGAPGEHPDGLAELFVGGEGLNAGAESVLATLLHEAAHGIASTRGIKDTSRGGRYHNKRYRQLGEEVGLTITQTPPIGWSGTELADGTAGEYADELEALALALTAYRHHEHYLPGQTSGGDGDQDDDTGGGEGDEDGQRRRPKNGVVLLCGCDRKIRTSSTAAEAGPILCGLCGQEFAERT